jgi:hypothetical protein
VSQRLQAALEVIRRLPGGAARLEEAGRRGARISTLPRLRSGDGYSAEEPLPNIDAFWLGQGESHGSCFLRLTPNDSSVE